ncbi:MAG: FprA family A-type flavoprotein [Clostridium sp.]|nr:FprA family A-type flavoprotein [Clostridiaceae bacterium]MDD6073232.1 FprA family A-type flavoprotein [Clostridium sp.]MDY5484701.1 FprA family A-type flavoprotein [Clostridium sp.]
MITKDIRYIGVDDKDLDLFEGQYIIPNGIAYNSYLILDDKIAVMDTVDQRKQEEFLANLERELGGRTPDYLVVSHVEPDHASSIKAVVEKYPGIQLVGNAKTFPMLSLYFDLDFSHAITVKEGDTLDLGHHKLTFLMAPMVHWPEVMVTYDSLDKVLFSADGFGKFGALDADEDWDCEARRYYFNIVGKFGAQVQALLKKAAALDIQVICPLHGPILKESIGHVLEKYQIWSSYGVESEGVFIAYSSLHGNTAQAAELLASMLKEKGCPKVAVTDLAREDMAEALEDAFRYGKVVLAASSYNGGVAPFMEDFLHHLKAKNYQKRTVGLVENGSWGPTAARTMKAVLETMKDISLVDPVVTIKGAVKESDKAALAKLAEELLR